MFDTHKPERPIVIILLLLQSLALLGASFSSVGVEAPTTVFSLAVCTAVMIGSLLLYCLGFEWARLISVVILPVASGLYMPEPFVTSYAPLALLIAPALALVVASPAWVVGGAVIQLLLLLVRAGFTGVYTSLLTLSLYFMIVGSLVIARIIADQARRRAEKQSRLLDEERMHLERRVAQRTGELEAANAELRQATQLRDMFLASVSHELRTPLNIILGSVELLREEIYGDLTARQHKSLATVAESGEHLLHLINDILDLAKMESGIFEIDEGVVHVPELCEQSVRLIAPAAERKGLRVELCVEAGIDVIPGDDRRLRQILLNLLSNAVKFTPSGAVGLDARLVEGGREVAFVVWDTGIGIDPERQHQLFQPFTQLDRRLAREYEGTGLGLALVAQLAARHGGTTGVSSVPGEGSRFWVRLPSGVPAAQPRTV
jgi:signal transduction histidine kinase